MKTITVRILQCKIQSLVARIDSLWTIVKSGKDYQNENLSMILQLENELSQVRHELQAINE